MNQFLKFARPALIQLLVMIGCLALTPSTVQAQAKEPTTSRSKTLANELKKSFRQYKALKKAGKTPEAIPHAKRAFELGERAFGRQHKTVAILANNLAKLYTSLKRYDEAEPLFKRVLLIRTKQLGREHPKVEAALLKLARLYKDNSKQRKATPLYQRLLALREKTYGVDHEKTGNALWMLANNYKYYGEYAKARTAFERLLPIAEKSLATNGDRIGNVYEKLAEVYRHLGHHSKAEPLLKQALAIKEKLHGPKSPKLTGTLLNLHILYKDMKFFTKELKTRRRLVNIEEAVHGSDHWTTQSSRQGLARRYAALGLIAEAKTLYLKIIAHKEKDHGTDYKLNARPLMELGKLYLRQGQIDKAEPLLRRAYVLATNKQDLGFDNFNSRIFVMLALADLYEYKKQYGEAEKILRRVRKSFRDAGEKGKHGFILNGIFLAEILHKMHRYKDAEELFQRSLKLVEKHNKFNNSWLKDAILNGLGDIHLATGQNIIAELFYTRALKTANRNRGKGQLGTLRAIEKLVQYYAQFGALEKALAHQRQATKILISASARMKSLSSDAGKTNEGSAKPFEHYRRHFLRHVQLAFQAARAHSANEKLAQSKPSVADLTNEAFLTAHRALGSTASSALAQMAARFSLGDGPLSRLVRQRQDLLIEWNLANNLQLKALSQSSKKRNREREDKQQNLLNSIEKRSHELDRQIKQGFPRYTALAKPQPLSIVQVQEQLGADEALILLLDTPKSGTTPAHTFIWAITSDKVIWQRSDLGGKALSDKVAKLRRALDPTSGTRSAKKTRGLASAEEEGFNLALAHELYVKLLGPVDGIIAAKKHLLVVASGSLTALPLHVLVSQKPEPDLQGYDKYRRASWLIKRQAITTLPSVSSLRSLRKIAKTTQRAELSLVGFADPVFSKAKPDPVAPAQSGKRGFSSYFRGGLADLTALAQLTQLPETRTELQSIAKTLNAEGKHIRLGRAASEAAVKSAKLDQYQVVYFATHGLISGDIKGLAEPALALSLPAKASSKDDGLLTASEITQLKLNADWLVMSACNTAAGDEPGAEALSGLARAFFYAGARTLLVSHWPVYSDAATKLTTHAFKGMNDAEKSGQPIGRSEALRRSMLSLLNDRSRDDNAHPSVWAPFIIVGEGAAR